VVVGIVLPCIMPNPFVATGMDVRSIGMALLVTVGSSLLLNRARFFSLLASLFRFLASLRLGRSGLRRRCGAGMRRWTMRGDVSPANAAHAPSFRASLILRQRGDCKQQERKEYAEKVFHFDLLEVCLEAIRCYV